MMGRTSGARVRSAALVAVGALAGFGCDDTFEDDYYGPLIYEVLPETVRGPFSLEFAYAGGDMWQYADVDPGLGNLNTVPAKVYMMKGVEGQYPIIDALPGTGEYSPFWQVVEVDPPSGYKANQIKSLQTIEDADLKMTVTDRIIHCPIVDPDATWTSNNGVPVEALGLDPMPAQVILGVGEEMSNSLFEYAAQYGATVEEVFGFLATPIEEPVLDDEGNPVLDENDQPVVQVIWPGFEFDPEFVAASLIRAEQAYVIDDQANQFDVILQPVWHKTLRGFCLPDRADDAPGYTATEDEFGDLQVGGFGALYEQFSPPVPGDPGDPENMIPPTEDVPPAPYGFTPIYNAAPGAAGYSPVVFPEGIITETPEQVTDAADLNLENSVGPIGDPMHAPLVRKINPGTIAGGN